MVSMVNAMGPVKKRIVELGAEAETRDVPQKGSQEVRAEIAE
jgi:hypothetical protein